jgi:hypothetical protein
MTTLIRDDRGALRLAQCTQLYAQFNLQFVTLPDPFDTRTWVVDLRDVGRPVAHPYTTWTQAEAARRQLIQEALLEAIG